MYMKLSNIARYSIQLVKLKSCVLNANLGASLIFPIYTYIPNPPHTYENIYTYIFGVYIIM